MRPYRRPQKFVQNPTAVVSNRLPPIVISLIQRENINTQPRLLRQHALSDPDILRILAPQFAIDPAITRIIGRVLEKEPLMIDHIVYDTAKRLIIAPQHIGIHIIVPWNETLMAHRPQKRSSRHGIRDAANTADAVKFFVYLQ